jgi:hypothetical protein
LCCNSGSKIPVGDFKKCLRHDNAGSSTLEQLISVLLVIILGIVAMALLYSIRFIIKFAYMQHFSKDFQTLKEDIITKSIY